ncbi:N-acetyltransferase [Actinoalloteichus sp. AHMU CJ021]|uniref:GNAT family N-acetyltransferase n=1 Tax=Actinoalloteichus TaxID=65496 RepID=UPI000427A2C6|nr:GNAT family N-acetyltransferase [Actinoalloteichus caeruleus]AUS81507.1 N-acetyltransferase [Actinoalloteichus sp. AHMU CJ021]
MDIEVRDVWERSRYEVLVDGRPGGFLDYQREPGLLVLTHAEVRPELGGRGVGGELTRRALDDIRGRGLAVRPRCPFVEQWIRRHPEYGDLVAGG